MAEMARTGKQVLDRYTDPGNGEEVPSHF
jgi:hypothetical protein